MKIVVDTNVLISGIFFGGFPRKILMSVIDRQFTACATVEIVDEYQEIVQEMIDRKEGHINKNIVAPLIKIMEIIEPVSNVKICRDPDDDKFISCAKDAHARYVVSGDKDLLVLKQYDNIQIVTAKLFCGKYLKK